MYNQASVLSKQFKLSILELHWLLLEVSWKLFKKLLTWQRGQEVRKQFFWRFYSLEILRDLWLGNIYEKNDFNSSSVALKCCEMKSSFFIAFFLCGMVVDAEMSGGTPLVNKSSIYGVGWGALLCFKLFYFFLCVVKERKP